MDNNICHFIPYRNDYHSIHTINLVFETKTQAFRGLRSQAVYKMHYVCTGSGRLHLTGKVIPLSAGDIFFTFPGEPFCLESVDEFTYMYASFLGSRTNQIMEQLSISPTHFHFPDCSDVYAFWQHGLTCKTELSDLLAESIVLYTFYYLGDKYLPSKGGNEKTGDFALRVKRFVDDNYSDPALSLEHIGEALFYSPKYVSSSFKKYFQISLSDYIATLRIQHACTLIQQGFTSVSDVSTQCGYSDPQYFSKIFKKKMKQIPRDYILDIKNQSPDL